MVTSLGCYCSYSWGTPRVSIVGVAGMCGERWVGWDGGWQRYGYGSCNVQGKMIQSNMEDYRGMVMEVSIRNLDGR